MLNKSFIWALRISIAILPFVGAGIGELVADKSENLQLVTTVVAWVIWSGCIFSVFFLHPVTLTVLRLTTPVITMTLVFTAFAQSFETMSIISAALGTAILLFSFNGDVGNCYVQASAYGDEQRFLLRPPVALVAPVVLVSAILVTLTIFAPLLIATEYFLLGSICLVVATVGDWFFARRIHQLSRRWFVFVPAGFVVHDETLLGTNMMIRKHDLVTMHLAKNDTQAADLTALTWGVPLELTFKQAQDVALTAISAKHLNALSAIHANSVLISPSRPGAVLRAAKTKLS